MHFYPPHKPPNRVPPAHRLKDLSVSNMPTWHGLVYIVRPLAQLRYSAHCAQCLRTETAERTERDSPASHPLCSACYPGGRSPSWSRSRASSSQRGVVERLLRLRQQWMERREPPRAQDGRRARTRTCAYYCWHGNHQGSQKKCFIS